MINKIQDIMDSVQKEDLVVSILLVHPDDSNEIKNHKWFIKPYYQANCQRPEWNGIVIGYLFGMTIIETNNITSGLPEAIPTPGGVGVILESLAKIRNDYTELHKKCEKLGIVEIVENK